jgi:ADP-heptose:LPS heptosyltransferase
VAAVSGPPRLLVLRALGLGDLLTAVPALRALADAFHDHQRMLACPRGLAPLAELAGVVDEVVDAQPLAPLLDGVNGVELAVNLHGRGPESHRVLQALEPRRLIAFESEAAGFRNGPRWRPDEHECVRWCRLLEESGIPADPGRLDLRSPPTPVAARPRGPTIVHPGAAAPARRWPTDRFAAVARAEAAAGRQVVITGSPSEAELAREVAGLAGLPGDVVVAGRTGLLELAGLVDAADRIVCGDTGIAHLATALRTPSVVLFGPVAPGLWGPPPDRPWHRALWAGEPGDPHAGEPSGGLLALAVDDVLAALADLPAATTTTAFVA